MRAKALITNKPMITRFSRRKTLIARRVEALQLPRQVRFLEKNRPVSNCPTPQPELAREIRLAGRLQDQGGRLELKNTEVLT